MSGACHAGPKGARRSRDHRGWSAGVARVSGLVAARRETLPALEIRLQISQTFARV
jgi:hypothetical protein